MDTRTHVKWSALPITGMVALLVACVPPLLAATGVADAATVYRCTGPHGELALQDTPCSGRAVSPPVDVRELPLIDPAAPAVPEPGRAHAKPSPRPRATGSTRARPKPAKPQTSWECRAGNGEVFYRHTRCPASVPGDGVVRIDYAERVATENPRRRQTAWDRVPVHGTAMSRAEACRRIRAAGAAGRDGHLRDDKASAYDRATGRDPCATE